MTARNGFLRSLSAAALCGWLASYGAAARGDDADLVGLLDSRIVTTASQTAETDSTAPATSTIIGADELRRYGIHTLGEAVDFLALGVSTGGGYAASSTLDLGARGVLLANDSGSHFLLLVDGHALNEPYFGSIPLGPELGFPLELVDRIEVVVGPGSVLYGSNAMLGVINVVTKDPSTLSGVHALVESELPVGHRGALLAGTTFQLFGERLELTTTLQHWRQYGPDFRLGPQNLGIDPISGAPARTERGGADTGIWGGLAERSSFAHVSGATLRLRAGNFWLLLAAGYSKSGRPFLGHDFDDPDSSSIGRSGTLDAKYSRLVTPQLRLSARLYANGGDLRDRWNASRALACPYPDVSTCEYESRVVARWAGTELQANYDWLGDARLTTLLGLDARLRSVGSRSDVAELSTGQYLEDSSGLVDASDRTLGAYLQQIWWPVPELSVNAGARLDRDPRFDAVLSPRAALTFSPWQRATVRTIYAEAFRAPNFYQSDYGDLITARSDSLRPEMVRSVEGSFEQRFGSHRVFFGVFRSWWRDLIEIRYLSFDEAQSAAERGLLPIAVPNIAFLQHQNAADIDSYGFNASLEGSFLSHRLLYSLHITEAYSRREAQAGDELLPVAPRLTAKARLAYELAAPLPTLALAGYLLPGRLADVGYDAGFQPPPFAPTQLDLRLTATGRVPVVPGLTYRLSVDYVFGTSGPYVIGPVLLALPENPRAELSPLAPLRGSLGLEYAFGEE